MASEQNLVVLGRSKVEVYIIKGDLTSEECDAIVCCTTKNLALSRGRVSNALLQAAGREMLIECEKNYPDGIDYEEVAVVRGCNLHCKEVFFIALPFFATGHNEQKVLENTITRCLHQANESGHESIAFPALGTGLLKYAGEMVAKTTFQCVEDFSNNHPTSSLKHVNIVIYHKDLESLQAFEEEARSRAEVNSQSGITKFSGAKPRTVKNLGVRSIICNHISNGNEDFTGFGKVEINIEYGTYEDTMADVIVNVTKPGGKLSDGEVTNALIKKAGSIMQKEYDNQKPHGVRPGNICKTAGHNLKCKYVYHGCLQIWDKDKIASAKKNLCNLVCKCLERAERDKIDSIAFPPLGTGEFDFPVDVAASTLYKCIKKHHQRGSEEYPNTIFIIIDKSWSGSSKIKEVYDTELRKAMNEDEEEEEVDKSKGAMYLLLELAAKNALERTMLPPRGTPTWYKHLYRANPRSPSYWTVFGDVKTLKDWLIETENITPQRIPVGHDTLNAVKKVVADTWQTDSVGLGRDAKGLDTLKYTNIRVTKVERIENCELFEKYALKRQELFQKAAKFGEFPKLYNIPGSSSKILTTESIPKDSALNQDIYEEINEHYMFHGTQKDVVDTIVKQGLDCRLGGSSAMFGQGVYAAESSTKSDQYADPKSNRSLDSEKQMFLVRMCLGRMCVQKNPQSLARAPCMKCLTDKCTCSESEFYDSVVADGSWKFREFVVYDRTQVYPEYLITYVRV